MKQTIFVRKTHTVFIFWIFLAAYFLPVDFIPFIPSHFLRFELGKLILYVDTLTVLVILLKKIFCLVKNG